jgi:hypothetical protein
MMDYRIKLAKERRKNKLFYDSLSEMIYNDHQEIYVHKFMINRIKEWSIYFYKQKCHDL